MPCDRKLKRGQSIKERASDIKKAVGRIERGLANRTVTAKVGPQGAIAFLGLTEEDRDGVTDACAYRRIIASGSAQAKQAILRAEMLAGRQVDKLVIGQGAHSHDGGATWHNHKG